MPIPTSIIVVVLVVAWLAVLVPMVAKRREHVPEMDEDGGRFRVLKRASASLGRRKGRNGTVDDDEPFAAGPFLLPGAPLTPGTGLSKKLVCCQWKCQPQKRAPQLEELQKR